MTTLKIREHEYIFDAQDNVIGNKPALALALSEIQSVTKRRDGNVTFTTNQGPIFYANRPLSMVFGEVINNPVAAARLAELPVYDEYTYTAANGKKAVSFDKRSAASYVPVGRF